MGCMYNELINREGILVVLVATAGMTSIDSSVAI
jgi:hypothetical protein